MVFICTLASSVNTVLIQYFSRSFAEKDDKSIPKEIEELEEETIEELELFTEEEAPKVEVVKPKKEVPKKEVSLQEIDDEILTIDDFLNDFKI